MKRTPLRRKSPLKAKKGLGPKDINALLGEGLISKASTFNSKPKPIRKRRKLRPGETSQMDVFRAIWEERPHVSEVSGLPLAPEPEDWKNEAQVIAWVSQFSHILPKGSYLAAKKDPKNIVLKTRGEHLLWETLKYNGIRAAIEDGSIDYPEGWTKVCDLRDELLEKYNGAIRQ